MTITPVVHLTRTLSDHTTAVTLCGMRIRTDHRAVREAKTSGPWVSCPLCEAALALDSITLEEPEEPDRPDGWTQPTFTGMENRP